MKNIINFLFYSIIFTSSLFAQNLDKVFLQLQWLDQFQFAGYYVAKEKGFYKDVGLDVEFKKFSNNINVTDEVINNKATYGIGRSSLLVDKSNGAGIKLLASVFQSSPIILIALKDSNITKIEDFKNKKMMSTSDATSTASFLAMGKKYGVDKKDILFQEHSFNIDDLINRKTDLMASYISNEPFLLKQRGVDITIFDPKDYGFDFYSDILFTSDDEIDNHRQRAIDFKNASLKGWKYAFTYIEETVDLILKKYNPQHKSKEALRYEAHKLRDLAYFKTQNIGIIETNKLQRIYDIYNVIGLINKDVNIKDFVLYTKNNQVDLTKKEKKYLEENKEFKICVLKDRLPYEGIKDGKFIGISSDFLNLIFKKLSISYKIIEVKNQIEFLKLLNSNKCDIKPILSAHKKINFNYTITEPYFKDSISLVTRIEQPFMNDLDILSEEKILIHNGFNNLIALVKEKYPNLKIREIESIEKGLELVLNKKAFGYIGTSLVSSLYIQKNFPKELKISNSFDRFNISFGVLKKDLILLNILNKSIKKIDEIEKNRILNRWVATTIEVKQDYSFIWKISLLFFTILLFLLYFNFKQKKLKNKLKNLNENLEMRVKKEVEINRIKDQQLQAQSRLAQMGEMISMIAHQWRQPLTAISATTSNLKFKIMMGEEIDKKLFEKEVDLIDNYTQHLSNTIDDFRGFFKEQTRKEKTTFMSIVKSTLDIAQVSIENKNIKIVKNFICEDEFEINVSEVKQVLLNLIKNAEDVLLEKNIKNPTITIESRFKENKKILIVRDNGGGIPSDIKDKIFDPYFSTKKVKDGTGLGLYMSKIIIEEHCGGKLNTYNDKYGAVFIIEFDIKS